LTATWKVSSQDETNLAHLFHLRPALFCPPQTQAIDSPVISLKDFHIETSKCESFACVRNISLLADDKPGDGREIISLYLHIKQSLDLSDFNRAEHVVIAVRCFNDLYYLFLLCVLVFNLAYDLFQNIFDRHESCPAAVLVNHHTKLPAR